MRQGGEATVFLPDDLKETVVNFDRNQQVVVKGNRINGTFKFETSTFSCAHCGSVEHVMPKADVNAVGFCRSCMKPICKTCSDKSCTPFEKKLEQMENSYHARRSYGLEG